MGCDKEKTLNNYIFLHQKIKQNKRMVVQKYMTKCNIICLLLIALIFNSVVVEQNNISVTKANTVATEAVTTIVSAFTIPNSKAHHKSATAATIFLTTARTPNAATKRYEFPSFRLSTLFKARTDRNSRSSTKSNNNDKNVKTTRTSTTITNTIDNNDSTLDDGILNDDNAPISPVPIILLAGFLGTGKTTLLKHLLENKDNLRIGVIVNDVASVNIDAKMIAQSSSLNSLMVSEDNDSSNTNEPPNDVQFVELQNGCVCCSLVDELFLSVEQLVLRHRTSRNRLRDSGGDRDDNYMQPLDAIVVELSGVADAMAMKHTWTMAPVFVQNLARLSKIVTLVDAGTFGTDYLSWDTTTDRSNEYHASSSERKIAELLVEQVEAATVIVLNKCDLATEEQIQVTQAVALALNPEAKIELVQFGKVSSPSSLLGCEVIQHQHAPEEQQQQQQQQQEKMELHDHNQELDHHHSHNPHEDSKDELTTAPSITTSTTCSDPVCTDPSHSHNHVHNHDDGECDSSNTGHSHTHADTTENTATTDAVQNRNNDLGLTNFVYRATRPFHPGKLMKVLNRWPVPIQDTLDIQLLQNAAKSGYEIRGKRSKQVSPFVGVIRSKGFAWFAPYQWLDDNDDDSMRSNDSWRHDTAMYWSHAGRQFGISAAGKWWSTLPDEQMRQYFVQNKVEYERIRSQDFVTNEFGDRRQEIVFIGTNLNSTLICQTLNNCLLTDHEMKHYRANVAKQQSLSLTSRSVASTIAASVSSSSKYV